MAGIDSFDLQEAVERQTGTKVMLENDVNLAVLSEQWLGAGGQQSRFHCPRGGHWRRLDRERHLVAWRGREVWLFAIRR
jgi:hypothetical protein